MEIIDILPDWIYTLILIPLGILYQKHYKLKNDHVQTKTNQDNYIKKIDELCKEQSKLSESVNQMRGELREHFRHK